MCINSDTFTAIAALENIQLVAYVHGIIAKGYKNKSSLTSSFIKLVILKALINPNVKADTIKPLIKSNEKVVSQ